jgi:hypothetical protein
MPEQIDGNFTVFVRFEYTVRATYLDSQAAQRAPQYVESLASMLGSSTAGEDVAIDWHAEVEGSQVVLCGNYLQMAATEWRPPSELNMTLRRSIRVLPFVPAFGTGPKLIDPLPFIEVLGECVLWIFGSMKSPRARSKSIAPKTLTPEQQEEIARERAERWLWHAEKALEAGDTIRAIRVFTAIANGRPGTIEAEKAQARLKEIAVADRSHHH